jgi:hypothetical protein
MNTELTILQDKLNTLLTKKLQSNDSVFEKIETDQNLLEDFILPLGAGNELEFANTENSLKMIVNGEAYDLHNNAQYQLGDKMGVPAKYLVGLTESEWGRDLAAKILNEHKENIARQRVLVRTIGNQARAVLSDHYKRMNSGQIYSEFIKAVQSQGAIFYDAAYSETKSYLSAVLPKVIEIPTLNNGNVYSVFGARLSNSDFGDGALEVRAFQMNVVCLNGMVAESAFKKIHLGGRISDNYELSSRTYELNSRTMASAIKDISSNILDVSVIQKNALSIQAASAKEIEIDTEIKKLPKLGMYKSEVKQVEKKLMESNPDDGVVGKPSLWKLSQSITSVANDIGGRRMQELAELSGKLILK